MVDGDGRRVQQYRRLVAEWPIGLPEPRRYWLTNLMERPLPELVSLVKQARRCRLGVADMKANFGLCDFEGRSYAGWHHHVTLASAAYAFSRLEALPDAAAPASPPGRPEQRRSGCGPRYAGISSRILRQFLPGT